jgi:hypothetical protein
MQSYLRLLRTPLRRAALAGALALACAGASAQSAPARPVPAAPDATGDAQPLAMPTVQIRPNAPKAPDAPMNSICSNGTTWEEADTVTVNFPNENVTVRMNRFDDALHVKVTIGQEEREMIRFYDGLTAVRASNDLGPRQFTGVDNLASAALHYLQQGFKTPCAASNAHHFSLDVQDGPKSDAAMVHLEGDMQQVGEALGYGMVVTEREGRADATILKTSGTWDFADLGDIPEDTSIAGWRVYRRNGEPVAFDLSVLHVVEDLKRLATNP